MAATMVCGKRPFDDYIGSDFPPSLSELPTTYKKFRHCSPSNGVNLPSKEPEAQDTLPVDGAGWVELLVKEMSSATSIADAKSRAANILQNLEKFISSRAGNNEALENANKENAMLKEQIEAVNRDNQVLKRAVAIQHERQKDYDDKNQEVEVLKPMVVRYQEELRTLRVSNYGLSLQLRNAEQGRPISGRLNPDVY